MRTKVLGRTSLIITYIIFVLVVLTARYEQIKTHKYTYIISNSVGKSDKCYVNNYDFRLCKYNGKLIKVDMFYEEDE